MLMFPFRTTRSSSSTEVCSCKKVRGRVPQRTIPEREKKHSRTKCIPGSLFASCSAHQMFDSSTSGGDLYLEQGDVALFEPPFLGSGWSVLCLADGARGTAPRPALEPVIPFHQ